MDKNTKVDEIVAKQLKVKQYFEEHPAFNPDRPEACDISADIMSRAQIALTTMNVNLGQAIAYYQTELDNRNYTRKNVWADEYFESKKITEVVGDKEKKITQKDAEVMADRAVAELDEEILEFTRQLNKVKNLRMDCDRLATSLQSRVGFERDELKSSLMPNAK